MGSRPPHHGHEARAPRPQGVKEPVVAIGQTGSLRRINRFILSKEPFYSPLPPQDASMRHTGRAGDRHGNERLHSCTEVRQQHSCQQ